MNKVNDLRKEIKKYLINVIALKNKTKMKEQVLKEWIKYKNLEKKKKQRIAYTRNFIYRRKVRILYRSWRDITKKIFKEKLNKDSKLYKDTLRSQTSLVVKICIPFIRTFRSTKRS